MPVPVLLSFYKRGGSLAVATAYGCTAVSGLASLHLVSLLEKGADVNAVDRLKKTAMTYAAGEGHTEVVVMLIAKGVVPNAVYQNDLTALMWAAGFGKTATVRALLDAGARPGGKDNSGKTALDMAREGGYAETVAVLEARR